MDGQTAVDIHVLQGERELVADNRSLARFKLRGIPPMPAGLARVEVQFQIDANGILNVTARELRTDIEQTIEVKPSYGLTDEEVQRMLADSRVHAEADSEMRLLIDARNEAETVIRATEKSLSSPEFGDVAMAELAGGETQQIQSALADLKAALPLSDREAILTRTVALNAGHTTPGGSHHEPFAAGGAVGTEHRTVLTRHWHPPGPVEFFGCRWRASPNLRIAEKVSEQLV